MSATPHTPEPRDDASPEEIEADISRTRRELGETVGELSDRLTPKAQAEQRIESIKHQVTGKVEDLRGKARDTADRARSAAGTRVQDARVRAAQVTEEPPEVPLWAAMSAGAALFAGIGAAILAARD